MAEGDIKVLRENAGGTFDEVNLWTYVNAISVANQADNRLLTATGTANSLNAEQYFTFDATTGKVYVGAGAGGWMELFNQHTSYTNTNKFAMYFNHYSQHSDGALDNEGCISGQYYKQGTQQTTYVYGMKFGVGLSSASAGTIYNIYGQDVSVWMEEGSTCSVGDVTFYNINTPTKGTTGSVSAVYGIKIGSLENFASTAVGLYSNIASGTNKWNVYIAGTASNFFNGKVGIGTNSQFPNAQLEVNGDVSAYKQTGYVAAAADYFTPMQSQYWDQRTDGGVYGQYYGALGGTIRKSSSCNVYGYTGIGANIYSDSNGSGYIHVAWGIQAVLSNTAGSTTTWGTTYGIWLQGSNPATVTWGTYYGIYQDGTSQSYYSPATYNYMIYGGFNIGTGGKTNYNLYLNGSAPNFFGGNVGIGGLPGTNKLRVEGNISQYYGTGYDTTAESYVMHSQGLDMNHALGDWEAYTGYQSVMRKFGASKIIGLEGMHFEIQINNGSSGQIIAATMINAGFATYAGSTSTIDNVYGIIVNATNAGGLTWGGWKGILLGTSTPATNNYAIYGGMDITGGKTVWNLYINGTASNYFAGRVGIGTNDPQDTLDVNGSIYLSAAPTTALIRWNTITTGSVNGLDWFRAAVWGSRFGVDPTTGDWIMWNTTSGTPVEKFRFRISGEFIMPTIYSGWAASYTAFDFTSHYWPISTSTPATQFKVFNTSGSGYNSRLDIYNGDDGKVVLCPTGSGTVQFGGSTTYYTLPVTKGSNGQALRIPAGGGTMEWYTPNAVSMEAGTATGQIAYWNNTSSIWKHSAYLTLLYDTNTDIRLDYNGAYGLRMYGTSAVTKLALYVGEAEFIRGELDTITKMYFPHLTGNGLLKTSGSNGYVTVDTTAYGTSNVSVANQSDNRIVTATGTTDALNAEANLVFDGSKLGINIASPNSSADIVGSLGTKAVNTGTTTLGDALFYFTRSASQTYTLPTGCQYRTYIIGYTNSSGTLAVNPGTNQTINGVAAGISIGVGQVYILNLYDGTDWLAWRIT